MIMAAARIFVSLYVVCLFFSIAHMGFIGDYNGELTGFRINMDVTLFILLSLLALISLLMPYFISFKVLSVVRVSHVLFQVKELRFSLFFLIWVTLNHIFLFSAGVGRVLSESSSPYSPIFNLFLIDSLFYIYFFLFREGLYKKVFFINVVLFLTLKVLQGWSSIILVVFFFELFFYLKRSDNFKNIGWVGSIAFSLILLFAGSFLYKYVYAIKNEIRGIPVSELTYIESIDKLSSRLTYLPIALGGIEKKADVVNYYLEEKMEYKEALASLRPLLPVGVMGDKDFRSLNNNVLQPFYPDITIRTSSDMGFFVYSYLLFSASPLDFLLWILTSISFFLVVWYVYQSFEVKKNDFSFLLFLMLFGFFYTASVEFVFSVYLIKIVFFIPVLWFFGVIKIRPRF